MNVVIIEDEKFLAEELSHYIGTVRKEWTVIKIISSVKEGLAYFSANKNYQLVFSDIQLGDGLSFDIFKQSTIHAPVVFCTAYNQYAIEAFKNNAIDYILKPFSRKVVEEAISRYERLKANLSSTQIDYQKIVQSLQPEKQQLTSLLVNQRDKIIPVKIEDIALFYINNGVVSLLDFKKNRFFVNQTLDELELTVGPCFYRTDRQHLVNRKAVKDVSQYFARKLLLNLLIDYAEAITVRKEKTAEFLDWLARN